MFFVGGLFRVLFYVLFIGCFSFLFDVGVRASVGDVEGEELVFDSSKVDVPLPAEVSVKKEVVPANVEKATVDDNFSVSYPSISTDATAIGIIFGFIFIM